MPFKSKAQAGYMYANHPEMAQEWASKTDFSKLPDRKGKSKKKRKGMLGSKLE